MSAPFKPTYLYIKQHNITGLKYFGKTTKLDPIEYLGSGQYWLKHLDKHGKDITTIWCQLYENKDELVEFALRFSKEQNIVESRDSNGKKIWANLIDENGLHGFPIGQERTAQHRRNLSKAQLGKPKNRSTEVKAIAAAKASAKLKGRKKPLGFGKQVSEKQVGLVRSNEAKEKMQKAWTNERRMAQSDRRRKQNIDSPLVACPHCGIQGNNLGNMHRHHFDNCYIVKPRLSKQRNTAAGRAFNWTLVSPIGETIEISNMREFCRENNLNSGTMSEVALGNRKQHKGWKVISVVRGDGTCLEK